MRVIYYLFVSVFIFGCAKTTPQIKDSDLSTSGTQATSSESLDSSVPPHSKYISVEDIKEIPQNGKVFSSKADSYKAFEEFQVQSDKKFNETFFKPWHMKRIYENSKSAFWGFDMYSNKKSYGENYLPIDKEWFEYQKKNAKIDEFNTLLKKAVTVVNTNMRLFPSDKPVFGNIKSAGEGFPFDYAQNSSIKVNSPILVSHLSLDKAWAFVQSSFALGWVPTRDIAFVDESFIQKFENDSYAVAIVDNFAVYDDSANFLFFTKVGTIFPIVDESRDNFTLLVPIRDSNSNGVIKKVTVSKKFVSKKPIKLDSKHISMLMDTLLHEPYSWGGLLGNRDCSSTTMDFLAPFGIYLPRNSASQKNVGNYIALKNYDNQTKEEMILKNGIPFLTLVYLKGHIMLYIGEYNGKPVVMHNTWGVRVDEDGVESRHIVGKTVITNLDLAKNVKGVKRTLLDRIEGIAILIDKNTANSIQRDAL